MSAWTEGRLRGFTTNNLPHIDAAQLQALAATGANVARVGMDLMECAACKVGGVHRLTDVTVERLRRTLDAAAQAGVRIILLGNADGTSIEQPLWREPDLQERLVAAWRRVADVVRNHPALVGLDLLNEPHPPMPDGRTEQPQRVWSALATRAIGAIRSSGCDAPIVFEPVAGGSTLGMAGLRPLPLEGVVYSFHFYTPHEITHQGVSDRWSRRIPYPADASYGLGGWDAKLGVGAIDARRLHAELQPVRAFQQTYRAPIYVGEFGCVRWAPDGSAQRWVSDCLDLFEAQRWHWTFHSFRTWPGWDAEVEADEPMDSRRRRSLTPLMRRLLGALASRP
jgi:endoglucanase